MIQTTTAAAASGASIAEEAAGIRARATVLLECLERARVECEANLARLKQPDALKSVTGKSAIENAIDATRESMDRINRVFGERGRDGDGGAV